MKCLACDDVLSDAEAVRRSPNTDDFIDLCTGCSVDLFDWDPQSIDDSLSEDVLVSLVPDDGVEDDSV